MTTVLRCGVALRDHVLAKNRKGPTLPMMPETRPIVLVDDNDAFLEAKRLVRERRKKRGRPPNEAISIVFGGPPPYSHQDPNWPDRRCNSYLYAGFSWWLRLLGEESLIIAAAIHRDESAAHLHLLAQARLNGRANWTAVQRKALPWVPGKRPYTVMHTVYNQNVAAHFGLERGVEGSEATHEEPDMVVAEACKQLRLRQIHKQRQLTRAAGRLPCGLKELKDPEAWELSVLEAMAEPGESERVAEWRETVGIPVPKAPQQPSKSYLGQRAKRQRIRALLETAKDKLDRLENLQLEHFIENRRQSDPVLAAEIEAWYKRVAMLTHAVDNNDFETIEDLNDNEPVPGYSADEWAEEQRKLKQDADAGDHSYDAQYELGREAEPADEARDSPSDEGRPEEKPG